MRIVCPACSAVYEVPQGMLVPGRATRCARCRSEWVPEPYPEPTEESPLPASPVEAPTLEAEPIIERLAEPPEPAALPPLDADRAPLVPMAVRELSPRDTRLLRIAWSASFLVIVLLLLAGYAWRDEIMQAWPPIQRLYGLLGLA